jgi:hypothetical protein
MADFNSSLPVRTQTNGDVVAFLADGTTPSQLLAISSAGHVSSNLFDGAGTAITSQASGGQRALDVGINVAGTQIDPRQIRALTSADVVTANQGTANTAANGWFVRVTDGTSNVAIKAASTAAAAADPSFVVALSPNSPLPTGSNTIGSVNQGTSPWITKDQSDGSASGGTAASFSSLAGGLYNTAFPTLTNGQQSAIQLDSSGRLIIAPLTSASIVTVSNFPTTVDTNYGAVGASTIRTASQIGNATGAANFGNGATGAQTLRVAANLAVAGADVTSTNPVPVTVVNTTLGAEVNKYNTSASVAAGSSVNHDYTITASKTFKGKMFWASASGKLKAEVQISPDGTTFTTYWVGFNSTATPNISINLDILTITDSGAGAKIRIIMTNKDNQAQDVYSTISGSEY